jgi:hypothetical protein
MRGKYRNEFAFNFLRSPFFFHCHDYVTSRLLFVIDMNSFIKIYNESTFHKLVMISTNDLLQY